MDLVIVNLSENTRYTVGKGVGRSLQKIPETGRFSYTKVEGDRVELRSMDPHARQDDLITSLPEGVQDVCWISQTRLLCGQGNSLLTYQLDGDDAWNPIGTFLEEDQHISRLAFDPMYGKLALVVEKKD